jgi:transposase
MTLHPQPNQAIPAETDEVAHAIYVNGNEHMRLRDELGPLYTDEQFADLYARQGQAAASPALLAWVTVLQFKEGWSDREAAEAVRGRIDIKYLLNLPLRDPGFHHSALGQFRQRLLAGGAEERLLDRILASCQERGFVRAGGRQRTDSTPVLAAVRDLNRLECVGETLRQALNHIAEFEPEWLQAQVPAEWYTWYGQRLEASHLAKSQSQAREWQARIGENGRLLLAALADARTPAYLRQLPAVQVLQRVWIQQYVWAQEGLRWRREEDGLPPSKHFIQSPYDAEARFRRKRQVGWTGYMVHMSESCDADTPHLITNVETVPAPTSDVTVTADIHAHLAQRHLLPAEHYVDMAFLSAPLLVTSHNQYGIELVGPVVTDNNWQAQTADGLDVTCFAIDWEAQVVRCPAGHHSQSWRLRDKQDHAAIEVRFAPGDCGPCPLRSRCTRSQVRTLGLHPQEEQLALNAARQRQAEAGFWNRYGRRAGIEGTLSQAVRTLGLRQTRYIGLAKTHLQHVATAVALNLSRLADWLDPLYRRQSLRISRFARLAPAPA